MRDLNTVGRKFYRVLYPKEKIVVLKECKYNAVYLELWSKHIHFTYFNVLGDLWGPLILSIFISVILHGDDVTGGPEFAQIFALIWVGAAAVTLTMKLLGGNM